MFNMKLLKYIYKKKKKLIVIYSICIEKQIIIIIIIMFIKLIHCEFIIKSCNFILNSSKKCNVMDYMCTNKFHGLTGHHKLSLSLCNHYQVCKCL